MKKILMVCLGNICRSPLAEAILQEKANRAGLQWEVDSAGTNGFHNGEAPHRLSQKVARQHGLDISRQRSRKIQPSDLENFDQVYVMAGDVIDEMKQVVGSRYDAAKVELLLNELYPGQDREVPDPWYGPESDYHEVYALLDKATDAIIEKYKK